MKKGTFMQLFCIKYKVLPLFSEQGKTGGHKPPLFPLPCHILAFSLPATMSHH